MGLVLADKAVEFIEAHRDEPFFLYFAAPHPHLPLTPHPRFQGTSAAGAYGDFIQELDWIVGQILATLKANGLTDDTLILFTSDNGGVDRLGKAHGHAPNGPWRGQKGQIYEGGHRVPFLVRWPRRVPAGAVSDALIGQIDLFASFHTLFGETIPEDAGEDSRDRLDVLLGDPAPEPGRPMVHHSSLGMFALRVGPWKYIDGRGPGGSYTAAEWPAIQRMEARQLYHLETDPDESENLYRDHPEMVEAFKAELEAIKTRGHSRQDAAHLLPSR